MVKAILTPAHTDTLEALLNQPLTGTFHHSGAQGKTQPLKGLISGVVVVALNVGLHLKQGGKSGGEAGAVDSPKASSTIAEPDHQGSGIDALASGF
jgi:hypothetical protein